MIYGFLAFCAFASWLTSAKSGNEPTLMMYDDYQLPCAELKFRRNEIDSIEKELIEIESDLRIIDDLSHIREIALRAQKMRLKAHLSRHKTRIDDMGYSQTEY
jgi:hypothetical protein